MLYQTGDTVSARMCGIPFGEGEIVSVTQEEAPYRIKFEDRKETYPFYEHEITLKSRNNLAVA